MVITRELTQKQLNDLNAQVVLLEEQYKECTRKKAEARAQGDLSENSEYDAATQELETISRNLRDLKEQIANSVLINIDTNADNKIIREGCIVTLKMEDTGIKELSSEGGYPYELVPDMSSIVTNKKSNAHHMISVKQTVGGLIKGRKWENTPILLNYRDRMNKERQLQILDVKFPT